MKSLLKVLFLSVFFILSCNKEKRYSIVGNWETAAVYRIDETGNFRWYEIPSYSRAKRLFNLSEAGSYYFFSDIPEGHGIYNYDYATKKLTLASSSNGSVQLVDVSYLDENFLTVDYYYNAVLLAREKFRRIKR